MALSDACFKFHSRVSAAASTLANEVPIQYGREIDALRRACAAVAEAPYDAGAGQRLFALAAAVMQFHDTPPGNLDEQKRHGRMHELIGLFEGKIDDDELKRLPALLEQVSSETPFTVGAAGRLRSILSKLGGPAYELAIKILGDIASAAAKKILGFCRIVTVSRGMPLGPRLSEPA